jgi:hypothetical protein
MAADPDERDYRFFTGELRPRPDRSTRPCKFFTTSL